ncbi:NADH:flavin oxidoreductase [Streptomyces violaceusniger]|uniref:NADH:flavin oxidoreductase/NADH oxidase n=1 Tax=Streptomyces violaceusniger (strain Tu 4113) TaxID=653045 RepID=G2P508_STRV4|nr:NADH:flavin oxidoreductase [Streptomyces violaceusniger]AEM84185.1 NADH:flavin oxidoreductase/NADH oxidase [Streptomyces violaceusniger Tu 4113]
MSEIDLSPLFTPHTIRSLTLAGRFVVPGMQRAMCKDGSPLPSLAQYYRRRVEGGFGLIISESTAIDHESATRQPAAAWIRPDTAESWRHCVKEVKSAGGHLLLQLWHEGAMRAAEGDDAWSTYPTISPSGLTQKGKVNGRAATTEDLRSLREAYVRSALLAQEIGFSGVEIHAAHGYLLDQFLWAETNLRADGYGGPDIQDRARFPAEVVAAVRADVRHDFIISFRLSQWKTTDFEASIVRSPDELELLLALIRHAGADIFNISTRRFDRPEWSGDLSLAGWAKKFTDATVMAVGGVGIKGDITDMLLGRESSPRLMASLMAVRRRFLAGEFDLLAIGRSSIADADFATKIRQSRFDEIRPFSLALLKEHMDSWGSTSERKDAVIADDTTP